MGVREKEKTKTHKWILILCVLFILLLFGVIGLLLLALGKEEQPVASVAPKKGNLVVDESNLATIEDQLSSKTEEGMFEVYMNTTWRFKEGDATSVNAVLANLEGNRYPITVEVHLNDTELLYSSTLIPVGNQIKEITLDKTLPKGIYDAVCTYHLWEEDGEENSSFGVNIVLSVE